ncbi:MAG: phosphatidylserine decarboxylase [Alphaproteobacteria bacterium]|jgi:phosphatidylserine decarboxylase|nr:phosphatidylserine decarboxylase [Alphaproteobacteria bacterium]
MDTLKSVLVPINREGYKFIAIFAVATLILFAIWVPLGWIGVILTLWCAYFFRDPERMVPQGEGLVIAPADGVVQLVGPAVPPAELGMGTDPRPRICIFMNVFNVHVNRNPVSGRVVALAYRPGKFVNAALDKASTDNERQSIRLRTDEGKEFAVVQIAGLVARRILCELTEGQGVRAGDRFGLIRFGSRVDVYLEPGMIPLVSPGQTTIAGETVLADYGPAPIAARLAERN